MPISVNIYEYDSATESEATLAKIQAVPGVTKAFWIKESDHRGDYRNRFRNVAIVETGDNTDTTAITDAIEKIDRVRYVSAILPDNIFRFSYEAKPSEDILERVSRAIYESLHSCEHVLSSNTGRNSSSQSFLKLDTSFKKKAGNSSILPHHLIVMETALQYEPEFYPQASANFSTVLDKMAAELVEKVTLAASNKAILTWRFNFHEIMSLPGEWTMCTMSRVDGIREFKGTINLTFIPHGYKKIW